VTIGKLFQGKVIGNWRPFGYVDYFYAFVYPYGLLQELKAHSRAFKRSLMQFVENSSQEEGNCVIASRGVKLPLTEVIPNQKTNARMAKVHKTIPVILPLKERIRRRKSLNRSLPNQ
jgi:hypothetical protein